MGNEFLVIIVSILSVGIYHFYNKSKLSNTTRDIDNRIKDVEDDYKKTVADITNFLSKYKSDSKDGK